jgi:hypothetical protein
MSEKIVVGQVIGTCGHRCTAYLSRADWPAESFLSPREYGYMAVNGPIVRDTVPCPSCRNDQTPEWDRTPESRAIERSRRATEARRIATNRGLSQSTIDRAASYASDLYRFGTVEAAIEAALPSQSCEHDWHRFGTTNGVEDVGCQKCGATRS